MTRQRARLVGVALLLAACRTGAPQPPQPEMGLPAVVRVDNQSWVDFHLYVSSDFREQRLGRTAAVTSGHFRIPDAFLAGQGLLLHFRLQPIGQRVSGITRRVRVMPGDTVLLTIPPG